jgi:hypothetical protein
MLESGGGIAEVRYAYSHEETGSQDSSPSASRPDNVPTIESLKNWTGFVSAWIEGPEHQRLEQDDDASVVLQPHQMYTLVLSMDTDRPKSSPTAEITIDQGEIANTVDFDFLLDSRNIALPPGERRVSVQPDGPPVFDRLSVQPPPPGVTDNIVVQVLQRYRLIQVLTLTVRTDLL